MNTQDALFDDILAQPGDDGIRRIYADWLEDHGQGERAELVRLQLDLARMEGGDERRPCLESRCLRLLERHRKEWLGPAAVEGASWTFHRGFPEEVEVEHHYLSARRPALLAAHPVRSLVLRRNGLSPTDLRSLLDDAPLERLESLDLGNNPLGSEGVRVLLESPVAHRLTHLGLARAGLNANAVELLCASGALARLESPRPDGQRPGHGGDPLPGGSAASLLPSTADSLRQPPDADQRARPGPVVVPARPALPGSRPQPARFRWHRRTVPLSVVP